MSLALVAGHGRHSDFLIARMFYLSSATSEQDYFSIVVAVLSCTGRSQFVVIESSAEWLMYFPQRRCSQRGDIS